MVSKSRKSNKSGAYLGYKYILVKCPKHIYNVGHIGTQMLVSKIGEIFGNKAHQGKNIHL